MDSRTTGGIDWWSRVAVVTVTHHSAGLVEGCLRSVAKARQVIVVDNASDDDTPSVVRRVLPGAHLIENDVGRGFGNGCNQGLAAVEAEFALLLGPDSTIDDASLAALVKAADTWPEAGMLGPAIVASDGHVEPSHDMGFFERVDAGKRKDQGLLPEGPLCADHLSGAVLLVRMSALSAVGGFDPNIFLYYEDDDLCLRMRRAGYSLILVPAARATHIGGGSSRPSLYHRWEKFWNMAWSRLYIEAKYHGRVPAIAVALRHGVKFAAKALGYAITLNGPKSLRDAARLAGTLAWLAGAKAMPKGLPD